MNLLFLNYIHPDHPHISALRVRRFADELAGFGHHVVLVTRTLNDTVAGDHVDRFADGMRRHDWTHPFHLACAPSDRPFLRSCRGDAGVGLRNSEKPMHPPFAWPSLVRKAGIVWSYARNGGVFKDWSEGVRPFLPAIAHDFKPDAVWGTFGCAEAAWIGREAARMSGAAWCLDIKDNWDHFVPAPFRRILARRMAGLAAVTANSRFMGDRFSKWSGKPYVTVYSGVDAPVPIESTADNSERMVFVGGSLYGDARFGEWVTGVCLWWKAHPEQRSGFRLVYAGADHERACCLLSRHPVPFPFEALPYMPQAEFLACCRRARLNAYIWSPFTFHHKSLEVAAAGRPLLAYPGEHEETRMSIERMGGELRICSDPERVAQTLAEVLNRSSVPVPVVPRGYTEWTWRAQAGVLQRVLAEAAERRLT